MSQTPVEGAEIGELNDWKWTGVTDVHQAHSETLQTARGTVQDAYDAAQGNGTTPRDGARLAAIELEAAKRQNHQPGVHDVPSV